MTRSSERCFRAYFLSVYWITILAVFVPVADGSSLAPWQDAAIAGSSAGGASMDMYADLPPTLFAPNGRLPAVERILQQTVGGSPQSLSSGSGSNLVVALQCRNGIAVVTTVPRSPYMSTYASANATSTNSTGSPMQLTPNKKEDTQEQEAGTSLLLDLDYYDDDDDDDDDETTVTPASFVSLSSSVWGVTAGNIVHAKVVERYWHEMASDLRRQETNVDAASGKLTFPTAVLARRWADYVQHGTQHLPGSDSYGLMAVQGIFFSSPPPSLSVESSPASNAAIWRVDPSGQFFLCRAAILGRGARSIEERFLTSLAAAGRVSDESASSSKDKEPVKPQLSPAEIRERLSQWTVEQALGVATDCIRSAETKDPRSSSLSSESVRPAVRLRGMTLVDGQVTWYNETTLALLRDNADWSA